MERNGTIQLFKKFKLRKISLIYDDTFKEIMMSANI